MMRNALLGIAAAAVATALVMASPTMAGARPAAAPSNAAPAVGAVSGPTDFGFAGYQVTKPKAPLNSASASFVVPSITCKKNFSGVGPSVVISSTGSKKRPSTFSGAGIGVGCQHKTPAYQAIITVNGTTSNPSFKVAAGDTFNVSVKMTTARTKVTVDDTTSGAHKTVLGKGRTGVTAQIGNRSLSINKKGVGLDPFTKTKITGAEVNRKSLTAEKAVRYTWVRGSRVLVAASRLTDGRTFTVSFRHS